jgi:hypothetical protein
MADEKLEVKYGLPEKVIFCKKCVISNQRPASSVEFKHILNSTHKTMNIDQDGICDACRFAEKKEQINWQEREKELIILLDKYRKNDGSYDCVVAFKCTGRITYGAEPGRSFQDANEHRSLFNTQLIGFFVEVGLCSGFNPV